MSGGKFLIWPVVNYNSVRCGLAMTLPFVMAMMSPYTCLCSSTALVPEYSLQFHLYGHCWPDGALAALQRWNAILNF